MGIMHVKCSDEMLNELIEVYENANPSTQTRCFGTYLALGELKRFRATGRTPEEIVDMAARCNILDGHNKQLREIRDDYWQQIAALKADLEQKTRELEHFREEYIKLNQFETTQSARLLQRCGELERKLERYRESEAALSAEGVE